MSREKEVQDAMAGIKLINTRIRMCKDIEGTPAQRMVILLTIAHLGQQPQKGLAKIAGVSPSAVSRHLDDLARWLVRTRDPMDSRRKLVSLSDDGQALMNEAFPDK